MQILPNFSFQELCNLAHKTLIFPHFFYILARGPEIYFLRSFFIPASLNFLMVKSAKNLEVDLKPSEFLKIKSAKTLTQKKGVGGGGGGGGARHQSNFPLFNYVPKLLKTFCNILFCSNVSTARQLPDNYPKANSNKGKIGVSVYHSYTKISILRLFITVI